MWLTMTAWGWSIPTIFVVGARTDPAQGSGRLHGSPGNPGRSPEADIARAAESRVEPRTTTGEGDGAWRGGVGASRPLQRRLVLTRLARRVVVAMESIWISQTTVTGTRRPGQLRGRLGVADGGALPVLPLGGGPGAHIVIS
jgi:hypothetical protein